MHSNDIRIGRCSGPICLAIVAALAITGLAQSSELEQASASLDAVIAVGPAELVAPTSVTVLGRSYSVSDTYGLTAGEKVAIHGTLQLDGTVSSAWAESLGPYVAGSDMVYEAGVVAAVNETFGTMTVNGSTVDYTASLASNDNSVPSTGQLVSVVGSQPAVGGTIFVSSTPSGNLAVRTAYNASGRIGSLFTTGGNARSQYTTGGNAGSLYTTGGNAQSQYTTGGNARSLYTTGGNARSQYTTGGNAGSLYTTGGNAQSQYTTGGNAGSLYTTGGNARSQYTTGGNAGSLYTTGGNVHSLYTTGGNAD